MVPILKITRSSHLNIWICSHESSIDLGYCIISSPQKMHQMVHWCEVLPSSCVFLFNKSHSLYIVIPKKIETVVGLYLIQAHMSKKNRIVPTMFPLCWVVLQTYSIDIPSGNQTWLENRPFIDDVAMKTSDIACSFQPPGLTRQKLSSPATRLG